MYRIEIYYNKKGELTFAQYDENDSAGVGYRTTIEKCRYAVEDFEW